MHYTAAALAAFATAAAAAGQASVQNNCDFPVYIWSVAVGNETTERGEFQPGKSWTEDYGEGTRELKIAQVEDALEGGDPQSSLVYTVAEGYVRYSLTHVLGTFFADLKAEGDSDEESCEAIIWENGPKGGLQSYCSSDASVTLTLCGDSEEGDDAESSPAQESGAVESSAAAGGEEEGDAEGEGEEETQE